MPATNDRPVVPVPPADTWRSATYGVQPPAGVTLHAWLDAWGPLAGYAGVIAAALAACQTTELCAATAPRPDPLDSAARARCTAQAHLAAGTPVPVDAQWLIDLLDRAAATGAAS